MDRWVLISSSFDVSNDVMNDVIMMFWRVLTRVPAGVRSTELSSLTSPLVTSAQKVV